MRTFKAGSMVLFRSRFGIIVEAIENTKPRQYNVDVMDQIVALPASNLVSLDLAFNYARSKPDTEFTAFVEPNGSLYVGKIYGENSILRMWATWSRNVVTSYNIAGGLNQASIPTPRMVMSAALIQPHFIRFTYNSETKQIKTNIVDIPIVPFGGLWRFDMTDQVKRIEESGLDLPEADPETPELYTENVNPENLADRLPVNLLGADADNLYDLLDRFPVSVISVSNQGENRLALVKFSDGHFGVFAMLYSRLLKVFESEDPVMGVWNNIVRLDSVGEAVTYLSEYQPLTTDTAWLEFRKEAVNWLQSL
jgi:hypothetical protein